MLINLSKKFYEHLCLYCIAKIDCRQPGTVKFGSFINYPYLLTKLYLLPSWRYDFQYLRNLLNKEATG